MAKYSSPSTHDDIKRKANWLYSGAQGDLEGCANLRGNN
jgi:hypothetical protein